MGKNKRVFSGNYDDDHPDPGVVIST